MKEERFSADVPRLLELLSERLYDEPLAFVRELLSNAVDATLSVPDGKVVIRFVPGDVLEISDNGTGISPDMVSDALGTIARSTKRRPDDQGMIGEYGIGLLATRSVARRVILRSTAGAVGVEWRWEGGDAYEWGTVPSRGRGTSISVFIREGSYAARVGHDELLAFVRDKMAFVPVPIYYGDGGMVLNDSRPPWRSRADVASWAVARDVNGAWCGAAQGLPAGHGGAAIVVPDAETSWYDEPRIYRRGVAIDGCLGLVGNELSWLKVWADLSGAVLTLDRRRLAAAAPAESKSELEALFDSMFLRELLGVILREASSSWWVRHRRNLLYLLDKIIGRNHLDSSSRELLREELRFTSEIGDLSVRELEQNASRGSLDMSFDGEYEHRVFNHLIQGNPLGVGVTRAGGPRMDETGEGPMASFVRLVNDALSDLGITLRLATRFGSDWEMARWEKRPHWAGSPRSSNAIIDLPALREQTLRTRQATLLLNPRCGSLRLLGDQLEHVNARAAGLLLAEWATAFVTHDRRRMDRLRAALFRLVGEEHPPPHEGEEPRCFVAYDWVHARKEFSAVQRAISGAPFFLKVLDASHESRGRFFLSNILEMMRSCQVLVSVFTQRRREDGSIGVNSNVLIEGGMAEALRSRPHLVCKKRGLVLPSDFDGVILVEFDDEQELERRLVEHAMQRGLGSPFRGDR